MAFIAVNFAMSNIHYILTSIGFQIYLIRIYSQKWNYYVKVRNLFMSLGIQTQVAF